MRKLKIFFKDKKNILITILNIIISFVLTLRIINDRINIEDIKTFNIWLFILVFIIISFAFSFFIFKPKKIGDFIYNNRFKISIFIFIIIVLGKFNGSSIPLWNNEIQPKEDFSNETIVGKGQLIRSDEWLVNTPYAISQKYNNYKYYNKLARGTKTDMYSSIFTPVADIIILARPFNIGYLLLGEEYGLSIYWYGRLIALLLVTFEFCMLITDNKKIPSLIGAIIIGCSPVTQWFYSNYIVDLLISGELCLLMFNKFLEKNGTKEKIIYSILIAFSFNCYALTLYPAWQIPLGYMYLIFAIWILSKNWKNNNHIKDYKFLLITIVLIGIMIGRYLYLGIDTIKIIMSTVYPGSRDLSGGGAAILNFVYPMSILFPISNYINPCEASGVYSLFPIPIICSIIYLRNDFKDKKNILLVLLTILSLIFTIYSMIEVPHIISKITLLNMSTGQRIMPVLEIICAYIMIMMIGKIKIEKNKIIITLGILISSLFIVYIGNKNNLEYGTIKKLALVTIILTISIYLFITSSSKINYILFTILMISLGIENLLLINPINIGTDVAHDKDFAKEIKKISKKDNNSNWIAIDSITLPNYILMNGGKVINSTNIYPNMSLWKKLDKKGKYEDIYNRYAHIEIDLTEEKTAFELVQPDYINLKLNYDDIDKLKIKYIVTRNEIKTKDEITENLNEIYSKDNIWIYEYSS